MPGRHHHRRATTRLGLRLKSINPHDCLVLSDPRGGSYGRRCGGKRSMTKVVRWTATEPCILLRLGALMADRLRVSCSADSSTVPKTILERERQAVDLIAAVQRISVRFKITWFWHSRSQFLKKRWCPNSELV